MFSWRDPGLAGISLIVALSASAAFADDASAPPQVAARRAWATPTSAVATAGRSDHPYKWWGAAMIGSGAWLVVASAFLARSVEGDRFRACRADARGIVNDCLDERDPNKALMGLGVGLIGGGSLVAHHHRGGMPAIKVGARGFSVVEHVRF